MPATLTETACRERMATSTLRRRVRQFGRMPRRVPVVRNPEY